MDPTGLIAFLIIGGVAGFLAGKFMRGGGFGLLGNIGIGVVGSFVGGFLFSTLGLSSGGWLGGIAAATVGAALLLWIVGLVKKA